MKALQRKKWRSGGRRGSAAIEFALWFLPMLMLISGIIDLSWFMSLKENMMRAAHDGARAGSATRDLDLSDSVDEVGDAAATTSQAVLDDLGYACPNAVTVSTTIVTLPNSGAELTELTVDVQCAADPLMGLLPFLGAGSPITQVSGHFVMLAD